MGCVCMSGRMRSGCRGLLHAAAAIREAPANLMMRMHARMHAVGHWLGSLQSTRKDGAPGACHQAWALQRA